ncbi:MAG: SDR family NAD(P)-dependent oxidoreductase [Bacillota bacterium]
MTKTIIVTGGSQDIGKEIVLQYAKKRFNVVIADVDEKAGREIEKECQMQSFNVSFIKTDVSQVSEIEFIMKALF